MEQLAAKIIGANSPVLWVELYSCTVTTCTVTKGMRTCLSALVTVKGEKVRNDNAFMSVWILFAYNSEVLYSDSPLSDPPLSDPPRTCDGNQSFVDGKCFMYYKKYIHAMWCAGSAMVFSQEDLLSVTKNFSSSNVIGKGGFGQVYRGRLRCADVAVKVLSKVCLSLSCTMCYVLCTAWSRSTGEWNILFISRR